MSLDLEKIIDYLVFYCFAQYFVFCCPIWHQFSSCQIQEFEKTKNNIMHVLAIPK